MNYGYGYIILDLGPELSARFHHSRTHSIRAGTHWMKKNRKGKKKKKSRIHIFSCFEHGSGTGTLHRMYAHHIPPAHDIVFFPLTSIPSHPSPPVMEISKGGRWGFGLFYLPLTTYDDF